MNGAGLTNKGVLPSLLMAIDKPATRRPQVMITVGVKLRALRAWGQLSRVTMIMANIWRGVEITEKGEVL